MRAILLLSFFLAAFAVSGQRHYVCYYTNRPPVIDGSGGEDAWQRVPWTQDFMDIRGDSLPKPPLRSRMKMLWDSTYLYLYAELEEPNLWGTLTRHDAVIYHDNDFEAFIDPDNDTQNYFELEINSLGTEMDLFMNKPYRNGGRPLLSWDAQGLKSAVHTEGTLNHPGDTDRGWSVEMAIPLKSVLFWGNRAVKDGDQWRVNFLRVEWDLDVHDGKYAPQVEADGKRKPEHNWSWAPQGLIDMHMPEMWGYLQFSSHSGGGDTVAFVKPEDMHLRMHLWGLYWRQRRFHENTGQYATNLEMLDFPAAFKDETGNSCVLDMEGGKQQYRATVSCDGTPLTASIDQDGKTTVEHQPDARQ